MIICTDERHLMHVSYDTYDNEHAAQDGSEVSVNDMSKDAELQHSWCYSRKMRVG